MARTSISGINKEKQKLLADRYLTYEYLNKLRFGNFEKLKKQIDEDIKNINNVKSIKDIKTLNKIRLKDAYDLYKRENKFNKNISKLKNNYYKNDTELFKFIMTSFSYIFNLKRNKKQYENNSMKAMQYAFWQTVVEVGGNYANFKIAANFLQHSLEENPSDLYINDGMVVEKICDDKKFKEKLNEVIKKRQKNNKVSFVKKNKDEESLNFNNNDLYFAINKVDVLKLDGIKTDDNKWNLEITLGDMYDYTEFKNIEEYYKDTNSVSKSMFSSTIYNLAHISVKLGVLKEYYTYINIKIDGYEVN